MSNLLKSEKIIYLFWGIITTIFYLVVRFISMYFINDPLFPVYIAQFTTIIFAFYVNKYFVFQKNIQARNILVQFFRFVLGRLFVALLDVVITYLFIKKYTDFIVNILFLDHINYSSFPFSITVVHDFIPNAYAFNSIIVVLFIQVLAVVLNYILSKWFIFD